MRRLLLWAAIIGFFSTAGYLLFYPGRWQLYPAAFGLAVTAIRLRYFPPRRWVWRVAVFPAFMGVIAYILCYSMPVDVLPPLSGPSAVGTQVFHWEDASRDNRAFDDERSRRELAVQAWYPISTREGGSSKREPYLREASSAWDAFAGRFGLPRFLGWYLPLIQSRSVPDVPLLEARALPVLIFSHGQMGSRAQDTFLLEELASRGFAVFAIDHEYDSVAMMTTQGDPVVTRALMVDASSREERVQTSIEWLRIRVADVQFVMNRLKTHWPGRLDLARIGIFGHALGGSTAAAVCSIDRRCRAGLSMDGVPPRGILATGTSAPFAFVMAETYFGGWLADRRPEAHPPIPAFGYPSYRIDVAGMAHGNFTDLPLLTPWHQYSLLTGEIDGRRGLEITRDILLDFFNSYLNGKGERQLRRKLEEIPEVNIRVN